MKAFARKLVVPFAVLFVLFGAFTTFVPCKYSSANAVGQRLRYIVGASAYEFPDCNCNSAWSQGDGDCAYGCNCSQWPEQGCCEAQEWGCGPFWMFECNGYSGCTPRVE